MAGPSTSTAADVPIKEEREDNYCVSADLLLENSVSPSNLSEPIVEIDLTLEDEVDEEPRQSIHQVNYLKLLLFFSLLINSFCIYQEENDFLIVPGCGGAKIYFDKTHRHFYYLNETRKQHAYRCSDSKLFVDPTKKKSEKLENCQKTPTTVHEHQLLSQEMLELVVIRWECVMRIFSNHRKETKSQLIESVLETWPNKLSLDSSVIGAKMSRFLNFFQKMEGDNEYVQTFFQTFSEDKLAHFRDVILQYRTASVRPGQF